MRKTAQGFWRGKHARDTGGPPGDAYRAVYTVRFAEVIYVLHCFQKKSRRGVETPRQDMDLIWRRLIAAEEDHKTYYAGGVKR